MVSLACRDRETCLLRVARRVQFQHRVASCPGSLAESTELINSISTASYMDNRQVGNTPLSFRGPDPDSDCYEDFRDYTGSLGGFN
ncbi:hypothetical protein HanPSC8_Chr15g0663101 [Helianthus annuus]|nr:hypothetical protein HanPSC8_Chr15g0663101 [Helianthus annuus]